MNLKFALFLLGTLSLFACGPNQQEQQDIAKVTCNLIGESRNADTVFRIKEINSAREKIGKPAFTGSDRDLKESLRFGLCEDLVLAKEDYADQLNNKWEEYRKQVAARHKVEEKLLEAKRKKEKEERDKQENIKKVAQNKWRDSIEDSFAGMDLKIQKARTYIGRLWIKLPSCTSFNGFSAELFVVLKDNLGTLRGNTRDWCNYDTHSTGGVSVSPSLGEDLTDEVLANLEKDPLGQIKEAYVLIDFVNFEDVKPSRRGKDLAGSNFPPLSDRHFVSPPAKINLGL